MRRRLLCLADVEARSVDWLWEPYLPLGMLTMLSGDPGAGKSFVALSLAANLSRGRLPDGRQVEPGNTLYLTRENPIAECIRPRFDLLDGDANRLYLLSEGESGDDDEESWYRSFSLSDVSMLEGKIAEIAARLVVVDPIQSYLGADVDLHRSNETRPILDELARIAATQRCVILLLRHLSKMSGGKAIHRGLGSIDFTGAVRSELLAGSLHDEPECRALVHIKANVGPMGKALGFMIDGEGRFSWTGESTISATDLLAAPSAPENQKIMEAREWLAEQLEQGSREQKEVRGLARDAGISYATLRRAKSALQVHAFKAGMSGPWLWSLPEDAQQNSEDAHTNDVSTFSKVSTFDNCCDGLPN